MFKNSELISTFHPNLSSGQLWKLRKMAITKKYLLKSGFKIFCKKARLLENEKKNFKEKFMVTGGMV